MSTYTVREGGESIKKRKKEKERKNAGKNVRRENGIEAWRSRKECGKEKEDKSKDLFILIPAKCKIF